MQLLVRIRDTQGARLVRVMGTLDSSTMADLEKHVQEALTRKIRWVVFELDEVDYVSSAGWGAMLAHLKAFRTEGGGIVFSGIPPHLQVSWRSLGIDGVAASVKTVDDAFKHIRASAPETT